MSVAARCKQWWWGLFLATAGMLQAQTIAISDLWEGVLEREALGEATVEYLGSPLALAALLEGRAAAAVVAAPEPLELPEGYSSFPVSFQGAVLVVHGGNPIDEVTLAELAEAFREGGSLRNWGALGGEGTWLNRNIQLQIVHNPRHLALELFRQRVLERQPLSPQVSFADTAQEAFNNLLEDPSLLLLVPSSRLPDFARALFIAEDGQRQAYQPTPENVLFGDYPLCFPFHVVYPQADADNAELRALLRALLSSELAERLQQAAFLPLDEEERRLTLRRFEALETAPAEDPS